MFGLVLQLFIAYKTGFLPESPLGRYHHRLSEKLGAKKALAPPSHSDTFMAIYEGYYRVDSEGS